MSGGERLFYDPRQPRMLSQHDVAALSPSDCAAASEQLDQQLVSILQDVDENFVRATRIITERILPALEAYGEASRDIWQSVKFWQTFFEAAAGLRFVDDGPADSREDDMTTVSHDVTLRADSPTSPGAAETTVEAGPSTRGQAVFSNELSDLDLLQKQIRQQFGTTAPSPHRSIDLTGEDILQPELETLSLGDLPGTRRRLEEKGKPRALPSPTKRDREILREVLLKGPTASTPGRAGQKTSSRSVAVAVPAEAADPSWSGLLDLSKTPLSAFASPMKKRSSGTKITNDSLDNDLEPPVLHHFSLPRSRSALARTPAKEAAKLVARDALEAAALRGAGDVDSPLLEPPSVLRNWATRGYDGGSATRFGPPTQSPSPSARAHAGAKSALVTGDDDDNDEVVEDSFTSAQAEWEEFAGGEEEGGSVSFAAKRGAFDDDDGAALDDTEELDLDAVAAEFAPPEDTLFGGRRATMGNRQSLAQRKSGPFQIRGPQGDEMATLHGGALSEAQPFQGSPLAGRDAKYGL